jgi:CRP/FNR family transcriptional regulator, cyclic AMP receptor protein
VVALEKTVALRVPEPAFSAIASQYPVLWRRLASDLVGRSRASNKYIQQVNDRPVVFVAASSDDFSIASFISEELSRDRTIVRLWKRNVFAAGNDTLAGLYGLINSSGFGVILAPDELFRSRSSASASIRDNMLLEIGMTTGVLGHARTLLVALNSNLPKSAEDSVQVVSPDFFMPHGDWREHAPALCNEIRRRVEYLGPR